MALAFILVFGGLLAAYMGLNNVSLGGILSDQPQPITPPNPTGGASAASGGSPGAAAVSGVGNAASGFVAGVASVAGSIAGGFLARGAKFIVGRKDQGRDGQTNPGGPIIAPGAGTVLRVASDPNGFGPNYPIVHFNTGPYAGKDIYIGHTHSALAPGASFQAGEILSHTGTSGVGNATVPGWFEIGFAPGGSPGPMGQVTPF